MELTKIELILAQLQRIFYHIGYFHCCIKIEKGETPEYIGLYKAVPEKCGFDGNSKRAFEIRFNCL